MCTGARTEGKFNQSEEYMSKAISFDPWSRSSLSLAMRIGCPSEGHFPHDEVNQKYDEFTNEGGRNLDEGLLNAILQRAQAALDMGYAEYSWTLAKILFRESPAEQKIATFFALAASSWNGSSAIAQLMQLLTYTDRKCDVLQVAVAACEISSESGQWEVFKQWKEVALSCGLSDSVSCARILYLEALCLSICGEQHGRALTLVESVIEKESVSEQESVASTYDFAVLQSYLLICQGDHEAGRDLLKQWQTENMSLRNLYFTVKALARTPSKLPGSAHSTKQNFFVGGFGKNLHQDLFQDHLREFFERPVNSPLERQMVEEIHLAYGHLRQGQLARLVC
jgi:hypothetical protein